MKRMKNEMKHAIRSAVKLLFSYFRLSGRSAIRLFHFAAAREIGMKRNELGFYKLKGENKEESQDCRKVLWPWHKALLCVRHKAHSSCVHTQYFFNPVEII